MPVSRELHMHSDDPLFFIRSLPPARNVDVSKILGNVPLDEKQLGVNTFAYFISTVGRSYGAETGERLRISQMDVWRRDGPSAEARTVCELEVDQAMCNVYGTLHGACAAYIIDPCSSSAIVQLGIATNTDGTGMSQAMNIIWHNSITVGTKLSVVSTAVSVKGRIRVSRCEIWDRDRDRLCISAVHSTMNIPLPIAGKKHGLRGKL